eukprot:scaffold15609_cov55-Attheya_sp.AAC.10
MIGQLEEEFLGRKMDSNISSPGSWTPVELATVDVMDEVMWMMQSPATPAPLDNTGKGTLDEASMGIILMVWGNLLENVEKLSEEFTSQNLNERQYQEAISTLLSKIQASINLSDVKIQLLILARIGDVPKGEDDSVSLRGAILPLQESSQEVGGTSQSLQELQEKVAHMLGSTDQKVGHEPFDYVKKAVTTPEQQINSGSGNAGSSPLFQVCSLTNYLRKFLFSKEWSLMKASSWMTIVLVESDGWLWDIFSVLVVVKPTKQLTEKDHADEQYSSLRVQSTPFENDLAASMIHEKPKLLYGSASHKDSFGNIPSYTDWVGQGNEPIKTKLNTPYIHDYLEGVCGIISTSKKGGGLARALLMKSHQRILSGTGAYVALFSQDGFYFKWSIVQCNMGGHEALSNQGVVVSASMSWKSSLRLASKVTLLLSKK